MTVPEVLVGGAEQMDPGWWGSMWRGARLSRWTPPGWGSGGGRHLGPCLCRFPGVEISEGGVGGGGGEGGLAGGARCGGGGEGRGGGASGGAGRRGGTLATV